MLQVLRCFVMSSFCINALATILSNPRTRRFERGLSSPPAHLFRQTVEVVEDGVICTRRDAAHGAHLLGLPGGDDEEAAAEASLEALLLGFPVGADGFFLEVDEG